MKVGQELRLAVKSNNGLPRKPIEERRGMWANRDRDKKTIDELFFVKQTIINRNSDIGFQKTTGKQSSIVASRGKLSL